jgi:uroporphyrinogen-III synthase
MRVVLTHPVPRGSALAAGLRGLGHTVCELPLRRLRPLTGEASARDPLEAADTFDWLVFVSPGAVEAALPVLLARRGGWAREGIGLIGPGTESVLRAAGLTPAQTGRWVRPARAPYDAQALLATPPFDAPAGRSMLVIRGEGGRDDWIDTLRARGARVQTVAVLRAEPLDPDPVALAQACGWLAASISEEPVAFVFTTGDAIERLDPLLPAAGRATAIALAVHPRLVGRLGELGWSTARLLEPGEAGLRLGIESARVKRRTPPACG